MDVNVLPSINKGSLLYSTPLHFTSLHFTSLYFILKKNKMKINTTVYFCSKVMDINNSTHIT